MLSLFSTDEVISVTALNRLAGELLELGIPRLWISGEISNFTLAASGHAYFSLKDNRAQVRCVLFRKQLALSGINPRNGMQVEIKGQVSIYEARGDFQINVDSIRNAGLGSMFEAYERLKIKLKAEGLFDQAKKFELPNFPQKIGIITSEKAAALKDILTTLARRMPSIQIIIYPTAVQGEKAAQQIANAINIANKRKEVDVLIISRGGGSIEDLWAFNEEIVARAVSTCSIPTISGVGHETDFTICDFVADKRAATPTAAAEMASKNRHDLILNLAQKKQQLSLSILNFINKNQQKVDYLSRALPSPQQRLALQKERIKTLHMQLKNAFCQKLDQQQQKLIQNKSSLTNFLPKIMNHKNLLDQLNLRLQHNMRQNITTNKRILNNCQSTLSALNPEAVLNRGYAIVKKENGNIVKSAAELKHKERILIKFAEGSTYANKD